jgi:rSAM/selenodomain-associated transferase 2
VASILPTGQTSGVREQGYRRWRWPARVLAVAGSVVAIWMVFRRLDAVALTAAFRSMDLAWYAAGHAVFGLGLLGSAIRWHLMLRLNPSVVVHGAASVRMVFISQFFNTLLGGPSGGDVPKTAVYSRWYGVPAAEVLAASVLDRMVASVGGLVFVGAAVTVGWWSGAFGFVARGEVEVPAGWIRIAGVLAVGLIGGLIYFGRRRPGSFVGRSIASLGRSLTWLLASRRRSGHALLCALLTALCFNLTQILCLRAVSEEALSVGRLLWLYQAVTVVASLPVTFAGAGLREGASMVLLGQYGVPAATAVAGALLTLSIHLTWAGIGGWLFVRERRRFQRRLSLPGVGGAKTVAVVLPTWNEAVDLPATLARLREVRGVESIVVADGGSTDGTPEVATRMGCQVVTSRRGRGHQLRAGAAQVTADVVLLVHADTWLPPEAGEAVFRCLRDPLVVGGGFWKAFRDAPWLMRGARFRCWLRLWWNGWVLGDQAMFVRRSALEAVGGVPAQPLMEEVELCRRLRRVGRLALAGAVVTTSARRFRVHGVWRTYWRMWKVFRAYRRGMDPEDLVRLYDRR